MVAGIKRFVFMVTIIVFYNAGIIYAQEYPPIENIMQQMAAMEKEMAYQNDEIRDLKARLDEQIGENIANAFNAAVFVREDLDQIVDKKIEEYFDKEENQEKLSSYIKFPLDIGYKNGFYFRTHDGKFSMKTNGRFQFRYSFEDFDRKDDDSSFRIRRARLFFKGHAYSENLKYFIQLRAESTGAKDRSKAVELFDWYVDLTHYPFANIRFGQWKVPFNRQRVVSAGNLQLIDRSVANNEFALDRQIGIQGFGKLFDKKLEYYFGFFNGNT
ncbi:MAG: porin [Candidatus Anammoxibacter sp.]